MQSEKLKASSKAQLAAVERQEQSKQLEQLQNEIAEGQQELQQIQESRESTSGENADRLTEIQQLTKQRDQLAEELRLEKQAAEEHGLRNAAANSQQQEVVNQLQREVVAGIAELKEIRRARNIAVPQPTELDEQLAAARANHQKLQERITEARAELQEFQENRQKADGKLTALNKLKAEIEADKQKLQQAAKLKQQMTDELNQIGSLADVKALESERTETKKQLSAAKELLARFRQQLKAVRQKAVGDQASSARLGGEIRSDLRATREVLNTLLDEQQANVEAGTTDATTLKPIEATQTPTEEPGERSPLDLDFSIRPKSKKAVSPVKHAVLEPYEGPDEDEIEFGEEYGPAGDQEYSADRGRQPGSFQMSLVSCGVGLVGLSMLAVAIGVAMWLYAAFENGTQVADTLMLYLPMAKIGIPAMWGLGSVLCLFAPRVVGARMEGFLALIGIGVMLGATWYWWDNLSATAWITICVSGVLYAYLLQSYLAEICSFGGFHTCEQICEKMMGLTTIVALCVVGLGIAWYTRVEPKSMLWGIQVTFLAAAILCICNVILVGRVMLNIAAEQSRGREWLLEHV